MKNILLSIVLLCGTLSVLAQAATTTNPAPATVFTAPQGASFNISLTVAGDAPFTYQWTKDGVAIPAPRGTASNLSFTSAASTDAGVYLCTITNSAGSTISNPGRVFVSVPMPIVLPPNTATLIIGPGASAPPGAAK